MTTTPIKRPFIDQSPDAHLERELTNSVKKQKTSLDERVSVLLPTTPPPTKLSPSSFESPTKSTIMTRFTGVSTIPQRTMTDMFPGYSLSSEEDLTFASVCPYPEFKLDKSYNAIDGNDRLLVQQLTETDCGITSFLMIYTDLIRTPPKKFALDHNYWNKHLSNGSFPDALKRILPNGSLNELGIQSQLRQVDINSHNHKDVLNICKTNLERTGRSIIASISFPETKGGHFIVIDKIDENDVYLRDPYTARAYKVPRDTFIKKTTDEELALFSFFTFENH